jgi:hypothetical protein
MLQSPFNLLRETSIENPVEARDGVVSEADPLALEIEDKELVKVLDKRIEDSKTFFNGPKYRLDTRRVKNELMLFGRQIASQISENKIRPYEAKYLDNAIYEIEASIKPVAMSRLPDMIVLPGNDNPESIDIAKNVSLMIDAELKQRETRKILSIAFKHLPVYYTGIIKVRWNPEKGETGDYEFENVHPENVIIDEQCPTNNADDMKFIAQAMKLTVQEVIMRFPDSEEEFTKELIKNGIKLKEDEKWKQMATTIKIWEVWFTWYNKKDDNKWERIEGVLWKYGDCILKKMKNPNYDYEGTEKYFKYQTPGDKASRQEASPQDLLMAAMGQPIPIQKDTVYRNYFDMPHKPYFFMGYDQWGKVAYDETSRIEQNIYNQENMDQIGKRIIEKLKERGKHVFSKESGMTGKDIERTDMNNPDQDLLVDGDTHRVHDFIPPEQPTQQEFGELKLARERMFSLAGATNLTGNLQTNVATSNQIAREANYTRIDDITEETINNAAEWMADWIMQMIKLRYTKDHMTKLLGMKGTYTFIKMNSNMIEEGMDVKIKASGTDKQNRQNNAMNMAKLKMVDLISFYEDMDMNDPEGRTEKLMMMQQDPNGYLMKYVMKTTPLQGALNILNAPAQPVAGMGPQAPPPGAQQTGPLGPPPGTPQVPPSVGGAVGPAPVNTSTMQSAPPMGVQASPSNGMLGGV